MILLTRAKLIIWFNVRRRSGEAGGANLTFKYNHWWVCETDRDRGSHENWSRFEVMGKLCQLDLHANSRNLKPAGPSELEEAWSEREAYKANLIFLPYQFNQTGGGRRTGESDASQVSEPHMYPISQPTFKIEGAASSSEGKNMNRFFRRCRQNQNKSHPWREIWKKVASLDKVVLRANL